MARYKDSVWNLPAQDAGPFNGLTNEHAILAVLMDIRDELKVLNTRSDIIVRNTNSLSCSNAQRIPRILDRISRNTAKPRKKKRKSNRDSEDSNG